MKRVCIFLLIAAVGGSGGNFGDAFLQIGTNPRSIALGQALVAVPQHPGGFLTNPGSIANVPDLSIHLMASNQFSLADYYSLGLTLPIGNRWFGALNVMALRVSDIAVRPDVRTVSSIEERRDMIRELSNSSYETFDDSETALIVSISRSHHLNLDLGWITEKVPFAVPVGINFRAIRKQFYELEGNGLGVDLGTMVIVELPYLLDIEWLGELSLGMAYRDALGTVIYWNTEHLDRIEPHFVRGVSYRHNLGFFRSKLLFTAQTSARFHGESRKGLEISVLDRVAVRIGNDLGQMQFGMGVIVPFLGKSLSVDYSFNNHELGQNHRVGTSVVF